MPIDFDCCMVSGNVPYPGGQITQDFTNVSNIKIIHNLGRYVNYRIIDNNGEEFGETVFNYPASDPLNQINVDWSAAGNLSGKIIIF